MNAFIDSVAKLPKWTLPIIMVAPAVAIVLFISILGDIKQAETIGMKEIVIDTEHVGVIRDPALNYDDCINGGNYFHLEDEICLLRGVLYAGTHNIPERFDVQLVYTGIIKFEFKSE